MKKRSPLILFATILFHLVSPAQKPRNSIGVSLGWQNFSFLDRHTSPLAYSTNSLFPKVGIFYNKQTARAYWNIQVSASKGSMYPSRFGARSYKTVWSSKDSFRYTVAPQFLHANIEASYFRKITSLSADKFQYWVGGTINEAAYYGDKIAGSPWLLNALDLAPAFRLDYMPLAKHSVTFTVDLSVLGVITRPIYALFPKSSKDKNVPAYFKQGTRVATLDQYQKVNFRAGYQYQVGRHFAAGVEYRLKWMHYTLPDDIRAVDKYFDVKFSYTY